MALHFTQSKTQRFTIPYYLHDLILFPTTFLYNFFYVPELAHPTAFALAVCPVRNTVPPRIFVVNSLSFFKSLFKSQSVYSGNLFDTTTAVLFLPILLIPTLFISNCIYHCLNMFIAHCLPPSSLLEC